MNQIGAKLAELLLGSGDHTGNFGPLVGQRRHDMTFRHIHPRSQNDRGDYLLQADTMSAMRLVFMRHDTVISTSIMREKWGISRFDIAVRSAIFSALWRNHHQFGDSAR